MGTGLAKQNSDSSADRATRRSASVLTRNRLNWRKLLPNQRACSERRASRQRGACSATLNQAPAFSVLWPAPGFFGVANVQLGRVRNDARDQTAYATRRIPLTLAPLLTRMPEPVHPIVVSMSRLPVALSFAGHAAALGLIVWVA